MSDQNELSGKVSLDTTDYKTGVTEINRQIRVVESGFRASAAAMGDWDKTADGLTLRTKALTQQIDLQKQKVGALTGEYEKVVKEKGNDSRAAQELLIKLNKQNEALGKMESELRDDRDALEKMGKESRIAGDKVEDLGKKSDTTAKKSGDFKGVLKDVGGVLKDVSKLALGLVAAVAGIGGAVGKLVMDTAVASDSLVEMSAKTGLSVEKLQELSFIGKQVGTDVDTVTGGMAKLIRNMDSARDGTGSAAEAFKMLGISTTDSDGKLRSSQDVFAEIIDKLGTMPNETERDAAAMALLGKSALELNPLIKAGSDELLRLTDEAHKVGAVMATEDVEGMAAFKDTVDGLTDGLKGTVGTLATAFLPAFQGLAGKAQGYLADLIGIVKGSNGDIGAAATGISGLFTNILTEMVTGAPDLLEGGLGILQGLITGIVQNIPTLIPAVIQMLMMLVNFIITNIPTLLTAAIQIVIAIAEGIAQALPTLIPTIAEIIPKIIKILIENLPLLIDATIQILLALANGLTTSLPILIDSLPGLITALVEALIQATPQLLLAAVQIILVLASGIVTAIPQLISAIAQAIKNIIDTFKKTNWGQIGKDLVKGLSDGFMAQWNSFKDNFVSSFNKMVALIKDLLGIASPSKVFADIGFNMAAGLGIGFFDELRSIQSEIGRVVTGNFGLPGAFSNNMGNLTRNSEAFAFYAPVYIQGSAGQSFGDTVKAKRW